MDKLLQSKIEQAYKGREFWMELIKNYNLDNSDYVLLLPSNRYDYNHFALFYLQEFLMKKNSKRAIVVSVSLEWSAKAKDYTPLITDVLQISEYEKNCLLSFYCLYEFTDRLIIASLSEPEGRLGTNIVDKKGITMEEVIKITLFDLYD